MAKKILLVSFVLILLGAISFFGYKIYLNKKNGGPQRQAVFMTNGQVYFGYVINPNAQVVTLKDIYYLKTQDLNVDSSTVDKKKIVLVKLGNELHSPKNVMYINRDQILFYQDLQANSKINDAIAKYNQSPQ